MLTTFIHRPKSSSLALDEERKKEKRIESTDGQVLSDGRMRDPDNKKERK
jgi:hypothetical protein